MARFLISALLVVTIVGEASGQQTISKGTLEVLVALIGGELQIRPVPLLQLELTSVADSTIHDSLRTGLDGRASQLLAPGAYLLRSLQPTSFGGTSYTWTLRVQIESGRTTHLELTNANADSTRAPSSGRQLAPEVLVYERLKRGILRISSGLGHGSGFLLDTLGGVVITNDHVVAGGQAISVTIDSSTKVPARVVVTDRDADLAILRFDTSACGGCPRLRLALPDSAGTIVMPGERVIAVGFPLSQQSSITGGIVSSVREHAIISDVNINHGNSGGPLLNMAGEVVGINAFGEPDRAGGPGVSGSISITRLGPLLARAADTMRHVPTPEPIRLPTLSGPAYPLSVIRSVADTASTGDYRDLAFGAGDFRISVVTPISQFVEFKAYEDTISRDRRKRERRAGLSEEQRYSDFAQLHDWIEYVGDYTTPAVVVEITPKVGETTGSLLVRAFLSPNLQAKLVFKGDLQDAFFYSNGEPVRPIRGGRTPQRVYEENRWIVMKDVAYRGYYVLSPEVFAPDSAGRPPSIVIQIDDLKHYDRLILRELPADVVARVWNDFAPYYAAVRPSASFTMAISEEFKSSFSRLCSASEFCSGMRRFERARQQ